MGFGWFALSEVEGQAREEDACEIVNKNRFFFKYNLYELQLGEIVAGCVRVCR